MGFGFGINNLAGYGQKNLFTPISIHWIKVGSFTTDRVTAVLYSLHSGMNCGGQLINEFNFKKIIFLSHDNLYNHSLDLNYRSFAGCIYMTILS